MKLYFYLLIVLVISACSGHKTKEDPKKEEIKTTTPAIEESLSNLDSKFSDDLNKVWAGYFKEDYTDTRAIDLLVVTNRKMKNGLMGCSNEQLGIEGDQVLKMGVCRINVPKNHTTGDINFTKDLRQSSHDYFKILAYRSLLEDKLIEYLKRSRRIPLIFVHGFNVRYQEAVLRATQLAYDLKYQGPVILFTWPAGAGDGFLDDKLLNVTYKNNTKTAADSVALFKNFLQTLKKANLKVNIMVHSMGHQVVLPAIESFIKDIKPTTDGLEAPIVIDDKTINELILNAPDYEANKFVELSSQIKKVAKRVTLYCSYNDNAMVASEVFNKTKRLGACADFEGIDTINVSQLDAPALGIGGLGHGYYSSRPILSDVFQVLLGVDAEKRLFIRKSEPNSTEKYFLRP